MKRIICLMLALLMLVPAAIAEPAATQTDISLSPLVFCDALESLVFGTSNVTLTGEAKFSLDGEWFKTAKIDYRQAEEDSYWDYRLTGLRHGVPTQNGYTIVANGEYYYVMESHPHPGTYRSGADTPQSTVLRKTVQAETMMMLLRQLAGQTDLLLGKDAVTVTAGSSGAEMNIRFGEDLPEFVNGSLFLFWQYAARRFLGTDYEGFEDQYGAPMAMYGTVSKAVLYSTRSLSVKKAEVTAKLDAFGALEQIAGSASVMLHTSRDGDKLLDVDFFLNVSDRGSTTVAKFDPQDYDVVLYREEDYADPDEEAMMELVEYMSDRAYFTWEKAGYEKEMEKYHSGSAWKEDDRIVTKRWTDGETESLNCVLDADGNLVYMRHEDGFCADPVRESYKDEKLVSETVKKTREFLFSRFPYTADKIGVLKFVCWREADGRVEFSFEQEKPAEGSEPFYITVRALPEWRVEYIGPDTNL